MSNFLLLKRSLLFYFVLTGIILNAQITGSIKREQQEEVVKYPQLQIKGLFQARYLVGVKKDVDVNRLHQADGSGTNNNFMVKYMRIQVHAKISKRTEVVALANLADFKNDPKKWVFKIYV